MKKIIDPQDNDSVLEIYQGSYVLLHQYNVSLRKIILQLIKDNEEEMLYILAVGCQHINGPFIWFNARISILTEPTDIPDYPNFIILDENAKFKLLCTSKPILIKSLIALDLSD